MTKKAGRGTVLTKEIAANFVKDQQSVDLTQFTAIEDEAAKVLLDYRGTLSLDGLSHVEALLKNLSASSLHEAGHESAEYNGGKDIGNGKQAEYSGELPSPRQADRPGTLTNSIGMKFLPVPAGTFLMGEPRKKRNGRFRESDSIQHEVTLTRNFYIEMTQVTQSEYEQVIGKNPSYFQGDRIADQDNSRFPVESVSWEEAMAFCAVLSALPKEKDAGNKYRLPTEAEWEYACRAGTTTTFCSGDDGESLDSYAWSRENSGGHPHVVALKTPNAWGIYDMHGNVDEWCVDWYADYPKFALFDPVGPAVGDARIIRGGCWEELRGLCRSTLRQSADPLIKGKALGFRVVLTRG